MTLIRRIVDNRVCLLGLDWIYREAMKPHEGTELLECARRVAGRLEVAPAEVPIEGYYSEDARLAEYFKLMRALQRIDRSRSSAVSGLPEFQRLHRVTSSPIFGRVRQSNKLLPAPSDPMTQALSETLLEWNVPRLTEAAARITRAQDDFSLVGLAARACDAVLLAATRESVVLYADPPAMMPRTRPVIEYVWAVDDEIAAAAGRFVREFNALCGEGLPVPEARCAEIYWSAHTANNVAGRCVRLGYDDSARPVRHYHWGIRRTGEGELGVEEFWDTEVWTTARYRADRAARRL